MVENFITVTANPLNIQIQAHGFYLTSLFYHISTTVYMPSWGMEKLTETFEVKWTSRDLLPSYHRLMDRN